MESFTVYKNAKVTRPKHYPVLVSRELVNLDRAPSGNCQTSGCDEAVQYLRVWLCPDTPGRITVANLNGVRYCARHAKELADATALPMLNVPADLAEYHDQVLDIENMVATQHVTDRLMASAVIIVAKLGTMHRHSDGTFQVTLNDGSRLAPCCRYVALRLIGFDFGGVVLPPHSPQCRANAPS